MRIRGNSVARSLIQRMASRFSRKGSISSKSGRCCRTSLFASSKVCAAPQTWYRGSRPIIATNPCSLIIVSPTATSRYGAASARAGGLFFTYTVLTNQPGGLQALNLRFLRNYSSFDRSSLEVPANVCRKSGIPRAGSRPQPCDGGEHAKDATTCAEKQAYDPEPASPCKGADRRDGNCD